MNLVEVVILVGAQCLSPMETGPGLTEVRKVPCAVLIREDPKTADVEFVPPAAATDPDVIAMLVKPRGRDDIVLKADRLPLAADDVTGSVTPAPAPRVVAASAPAAPGAPAITDKKPRARRAAVARKNVKLVRRSDSCGSYRAVWYTNNDGHRRYRCVKPG